ncbi:CPBP family intramembrane glutamic endopeptidase [Cellulomonas xiejunii]|uniref:CPBP family intramembrane metalloprotease n=1 Tax=Cellulomonas xiejunii TaxID=2968083 RepID=A0ABY5KU68_9CELL|nr:type II CAAX endopeptidase family protein [Cellulomonas xiejunii]MCC2315569.1 CPBP family intramembrane metalloprotease [Cellulomonas xiejunii]MCC2322647.1 CPBP family intramembrane metalloprotease [Cellulomonas xiejunii]UUI72685.1 CPBP family intramembrane metalloprotease [Cellulomonas xiejunii]
MSSTHVVVDPREAPGAYAYHRLGRTRPGSRWWRPLLVGVVALALYVVLVAVGGVLAMVAAVASGPEGLQTLATVDVLDLRDPLAFTLGMLSIIALLPASVVATWLLGARPVGLLASVVGRVRWGWAARCLALSVALTVVVQVIEYVRAVVEGTPWRPRVDEATWPLLVLVVLLVPAQCIAEEVVFRGYLVQTVGTWLRHPAFAIVLPVPLFVLGHTYVNLAMVDTAVWALAMGWLVWRTGGLEAAAAAHVVNNVLVFGLGAVNLADLDLVDIPLDVLAESTLATLVYVGLVEVLVRRTGVANLRVVTPPAPPSVPDAPVTPGGAPAHLPGPQRPRDVTGWVSPSP